VGAAGSSPSSAQAAPLHPAAAAVYRELGLIR